MLHFFWCTFLLCWNQAGVLKWQLYDMELVVNGPKNESGEWLCLRSREAIWLSSDIRQQFRGVCFQVWDRSLSPPSAKQNFWIIFLVKILLLGYQPIDAPSYPSSANQNFWIFFVVNNSCFLVKMLCLGYHWISIISPSAIDTLSVQNYSLFGQQWLLGCFG